MIAREKEAAFMEWVKVNCSESENGFLDLLRKKLSELDDNSLEFFINSVRNQVATNTVITSYQQSNQIKWNIYSFILINDLATELLHGQKNLMDIITKLGNERHYIALDLGHGQLHWRKDFGAIRGVKTSETEACYEHILKQDTVFSYLFNPISREIDKLIDDNFFTTITEEQMFEDTMASKLLWSNDWNAEKKLVLVTELPNKSDGMCVLVRKNRDDNSIEAIGVTYPTIEKKNIQTRVQELQPLFDKILEINPKNERDLKNFLMALGELSYHLYRLLPIRQGNSAVVDWIVRGIAECKQIQLGARKNNDLPADFQAFLAKNITVYCNWFEQNAFDNPHLLYQNEPIKTESTAISSFGFFSQTSALQFANKLDSELPNLIRRENALSDIYNNLSGYAISVEMKDKAIEYSSYDYPTRLKVIQAFEEQVSPLIKVEIEKLKNLPLNILEELNKTIKNSRKEGLNPYNDLAKLHTQGQKKWVAGH